MVASFKSSQCMRLYRHSWKTLWALVCNPYHLRSIIYYYYYLMMMMMTMLMCWPSECSSSNWNCKNDRFIYKINKFYSGSVIENTHELCAILLTENIRTEPSAQHDANFVPLEFHTILFTSAEWSFSSLSWEPAAKSNMRIFDSSPPAAKYLPSGLKLTQCTGKWQSIKILDTLPLVTSHNRTVKSVEPVAK